LFIFRKIFLNNKPRKIITIAPGTHITDKNNNGGGEKFNCQKISTDSNSAAKANSSTTKQYMYTVVDPKFLKKFLLRIAK
jgi:hypothetical protein